MSTGHDEERYSAKYIMLCMVLTFIGGYFLGSFTSGGNPAGLKPVDVSRAERFHVPLNASPSLGPPDALVTIVEYADFRCGHCAQSVHLQRRVREAFAAQVRWVFKPFPLRRVTRTGERTQSMNAAVASLAAHAQGKFWPYHDLLFARQRRLGQGGLEQIARDLGLDLTRFQAALTGEELGRVVNQEHQRAEALKINSTPTLFINGRRFVGSPSFAHLEQRIREELAYTQQLLREGAVREGLYRQVTGGAAAQQGRDPAGAASVPPKSPTS